jgi:hypothetical protein
MAVEARELRTGGETVITREPSPNLPGSALMNSFLDMGRAISV